MRNFRSSLHIQISRGNIVSAVKFPQWIVGLNYPYGNYINATLIAKGEALNLISIPHACFLISPIVIQWY